MESWSHLAEIGLVQKLPATREQEMYTNMFAIFRKILPDMSIELENEIRKRCVVVRFKKSAVVTDIGEVCKYCFFAVKGLVKAVREPGKVERINWFMGAGDVIISVKSFYKQVPSKERLEVMKQTECIALHNDDLQWIYRNYIEFNIVGRILAEEYYCDCDERASWNGLDGQAKFNALLEAYPEILERIPKVDIAAFLRISVPTMYRWIKAWKMAQSLSFDTKMDDFE